MRAGAVAAQLMLAACLMASTSGCAPELDALQSDPMATEDIASLEEIDGHVDRGSDGGMLGKPEPAMVMRIFAVSSEDEGLDAVAAARTMAVDAGWKIDYDAPSGDAFVGKRALDGEPASLTVGYEDDPDLVDSPRVYVHLSTSVD